MSSTLILALFGLRQEHILLLIAIGVIAFLLSSPRRGGRRCRRCQEINPSHARYCSQCGQILNRK